MASEEFSEASEASGPMFRSAILFWKSFYLRLPGGHANRRHVGIQDMGAAGLTCFHCEWAARPVGTEIELDLVPQRETGMTA